jgi:inositol polyphosphate 5-phosphatase INPP5B/F
MSVSPTYGMLIPGEETVTLDFSITIDNNTAQNLNSGREVLEDILILRLEGGRDYYITVRATYARSCFGMSVDELVLYSEPIRTVPLDPIQKAATFGVDMNANTSALCVPKELWRLVDAVHQKGLGTPGIFIEAGLADEVTHIRECLDTGTQFGTYRIHSYSEALLSFLGSLSSPIIPPSLFPTVEIDSLNIQSMSRRVLEDLAPINYNVLVYIISFFREALRLREQNGLTAAKVARICSQCLSPSTGSATQTTSVLQRTGMQLIILHLLETSSI